MTDFYTPELARALRLTRTETYDQLFEALRTQPGVKVVWAGGHHACADQLAGIAMSELRDRITAMKALDGRTVGQFFFDRAFNNLIDNRTLTHRPRTTWLTTRIA